MKLSLIGMSGTGKTYWSKKLEPAGFKRFGCDDLIEAQLKLELLKAGLKNGINHVSRWLGQPFDQRHSQNSRKYLKLEHQALKQILSQIAYLPSAAKVVIDTTGSVIYLPKSTLNQLRQLTQIVYLETPTSVRQNMLKLYLNDPKPVIWGQTFNRPS